MNPDPKDKLFFRKNTVRDQVNFRFVSPKRSRNQLNPFTYLSPKARVPDEVSYRNYLSLTTEKKIIKVTEQNANLKICLRQTKLGKKKVDIENNQLRKKLNNYNQEIQRLKRQCEQSKNIGTQDSILLQSNDSCCVLAELGQIKDMENEYAKMKRQNQMLQNTLKDSNSTIYKLNNQIQKSNLGVWLLNKRLDQKLKELANIKAQKMKSKLFELSSEEQEQLLV